jgi:hypothetical protein
LSSSNQNVDRKHPPGFGSFDRTCLFAVIGAALKVPKVTIDTTAKEQSKAAQLSVF